MIFNLLIVDDEAPIRKGLSEYIKWEDYDCKVVATANNGEDAITKINENRSFYYVLSQKPRRKT